MRSEDGSRPAAERRSAERDRGPRQWPGRGAALAARLAARTPRPDPAPGPDPDLPVDAVALAAGVVQVLSDLFALRLRGDPPVWRVQGRMDGGLARDALQSLCAGGLRSGALSAAPGMRRDGRARQGIIDL